MKFATFNVNGLGARLPRLIDWLHEAAPDVVGLQEIKCEEANFPALELQQAGYQALVAGQKGFNGVAILARGPAELVLDRLPGEPDDTQARYLEARIAGVRFSCLYLPNGNPQPGPKFDYKLRWMDRLAERAALLLQTEEPVILAGDYNVCPTDFDAARPEALADDAIAHPKARHRFRALAAAGWTDALRAAHPGAPCYSYWDYKGGAWQRNWGLRIDHLLLSPAAADRMQQAGVDRAARGAERPSDHAPAWVVLD